MLGLQFDLDQFSIEITVPHHDLSCGFMITRSDHHEFVVARQELNGEV